MTIDLKRLREVANHAIGYVEIAPDEVHELLDEIDRLTAENERLQGIANAFQIVKEQRDSLREQLAIVRGLPCHDCNGTGNREHAYPKQCGTCGGTGKRVPKLEDEA